MVITGDIHLITRRSDRSPHRALFLVATSSLFAWLSLVGCLLVTLHLTG